MAHKILVADDSLTVQKVVSITLSSFDYDLVECKDESQLNENLMVGGVSLLLLDLNLSEGKSGYEVAKSVRQKHPELPIILLLGTFDSVDETAFTAAGISDRIVKPFESSTFTQKVQAVIESSSGLSGDLGSGSTIFSGETESNFLESNLEDVTPESEMTIDNGDNWVVDSPSPEDKSSESWDSFSQADSSGKDNALEASLEGWGMNVPGQIGSENSDMDMALPGVISEKVSQEVVVEAEAELDIVHQQEDKLPSESNLDYPDIGEPEAREQSVFKEVEHQPTTALLSEDEFNLDVASDSVAESSLEQAVETEEDADDFWAADDASENSKSSVSIEEEVEAEDEEEAFHAEPDEEQLHTVSLDDSISLEPLDDPRGNQPFELSPQHASAPESSPQVNTDEIVAKILEDLKPMLNELVEKHCKETIENVAWQIIPDLAENLIRSEIKEIKESN